ncbi:putative T7SS-secreted protein [Streptomyces sp. NBC_01014]|uniref:putative T7SS-secreted protein n=1 Tax=Streptomyces sp. NBC_01014 TaxID=2903719 RepID=UPI0038682E4C|nr:hypothetical protein OG282_13460 [Streptomyces sp. NBC_01014]
MSRRSSEWPPLWDDDPTPGDPYEVAELGRKLRKTADMIEEQARTIKALSSVEGWDSDAGRAFNEIADGAGDRLKKAFDRYDEASNALGVTVRDGESKEFASELRRAQQKADKGLSDYREAKADFDEAERQIKKYTEKYPDHNIPAAEEAEYERWQKKHSEAMRGMGHARKEVKDAREIFDDAGDRAARRIKNVVHHDSVRDPGGFMNWVADWADRFSNISAVLSVLAVICALVPPLQFLAPIFATLAVLSSATALAGHAYDMSVRGGKVNWLKLGTDTLGVLPGIGAFKGFRSVSKLGGLAKIKGVRFGGLQAIDGIGHNFLNGFSVTIANKTLAAGIKLGTKLKVPNLPAELAPIGGKQITAVIKGVGFGGAVKRIFDGDNGHKTGYQAPHKPAPTTPTLTPSPSPGASPKPFHAALAA